MKAAAITGRSAGSLTSRIVLAVFLSLLTPPLIPFIFFLGVPFQEVRIFSTKWVVDRTSQVVDLLDNVPANTRNGTVPLLNSIPDLEFKLIDDATPSNQQSDSNAFVGNSIILKNELLSRIQLSPNDIIVRTGEPQSLLPFPLGQFQFRSAPDAASGQAKTYAKLKLADGDVPLPSIFTISVRLGDGQWLEVRPTPAISTWTQVTRFVMVFGLTIGLLAVVVLVTARSLIRPLTALGSAVENFGERYVAEPIPNLGIAEYDRIAAKFNQLQVQIATYLRERTQMIGAISHDLRTPLTRLRLFAEYLGDEEIKKQAISSIEDMHLLIEDTLNYARGLFLNEKRSTADVAVMLMTEVDAQTDLGRTAQYDGPNHAPLLCHPIALRRAFANLVENGVKYGKAVGITLSASDRELTVSIVDQGAGFPPEKEDIALSPFERLETSRSRETGGAGLGLTIARDVIMRHGGTLKFRQLPGNGFEARVTLPTILSTGILIEANQAA